MTGYPVTAYQVAERLLGTREEPGARANPLVLAMLRLQDRTVEDDATAWCSALVGFVCFLLGLPQSHSLAARAWLRVGEVVPLETARVGWDLVVLSRGPLPQPGPEVLAAPGHVGFYGGRVGASVLVLGGNQADAVSVARFPAARVLGVRRLWTPGEGPS